MKQSLLLVLFLSSLTSFAADGNSVLAKCIFQRSASISFGYSWVYTFKGQIKDAGLNGDHFYEVEGPASVSIDQTASTNFPGKHIGNFTANIENHPWGRNILLDISSPNFRITVFPGERDGRWSAYEIDNLQSIGLAGTCFDIAPELQEN